MTYNDQKPNPEMREKVEALGENSLVRLGFVLGLLTMFGAAVWWASGIQSDLASIKVTLARFSSIDMLESRVKNIEQYGSPSLQELDKRVMALRSDFELHKAMTAKPSNNPKPTE